MNGSSADSPLRRRSVFYAAGGLGVLLLLWLGAYLAAGGGIARGTTVLGVDIGGMSEQEAEQTLTRELADEAAAPVPVRVGDERLEVDPAEAGLRLDAAATVEAADRRTWNPFALVASLLGAGDLDPSVAVDDAALAGAVTRLAERIDGKPVEGDVQFEDGEVVRVEPEPGRSVVQERAMDRISAAYLRADGPVVLRPRVQRPAVDVAEVDRAVREFAEPAMSGPVVLQVADEEISVPPEVVGRALEMTPDAENRLQPVLDGAVLKKAVARQLGPLEQPARDATFRIGDNGPRVVPARPGRTVDPGLLSTAVLPALTLTGSERTVTVTLQTSEPELTTAEARALGVKELVSEFTTYYPSDFQPRLTNIHTAADYMDNTLLLPGETFSMNDEVGERTAARGFAQGYIISGGRLQVDYGGGVSQLATTTFNAAFFAGLEDVEHHPHSFYISRYPEGREATVAWGAKDLRFRNDTDTGVFITTSYTNSSVTVRIWGTKRYEVTATKSPRYAVKGFRTIYDPRPAGSTPGSCVPQPGVVGFQVDVTRTISRNGTRVKSEKMHTVYNPEARIVCGRSGPAPSTPRPRPTPSPTTPPPD